MPSVVIFITPFLKGRVAILYLLAIFPSSTLNTAARSIAYLHRSIAGFGSSLNAVTRRNAVKFLACLRLYHQGLI
jgi:hypothetical protein